MDNQLFSDKNVKLVVTAKTIKGTSFVGIRDYENKQGEVSNYTINVGINFLNVLKNDFNALKENQNKIIQTLEKNHSIELIKQGYNELLTSLEKRLTDEQTKEELRSQGDKTILASDAQIDAYIQIAKGVKLHKESLKLHVFGLIVKKTVLKPIEHKTVNSRELTIIKNKIEKLCEFKQSKYRTFIFDKADVKLQGIEIK